MADLNVINRVRFIASHAITGALHSEETSEAKQKEAKVRFSVKFLRWFHAGSRRRWWIFDTIRCGAMMDFWRNSLLF